MFFTKKNLFCILKKRPDSYLGPNVSFNGCIVTTGLLSIDGKFEGKIDGDSILIGQGSTVVAQINVKNVHMRGNVRGNIICSEFAFLDDSVDFVGELSTPNLEVRKGAKIDAKIISSN